MNSSLEEVKELIAYNLRKMRFRKKLTLDDVEEKSGVSRVTICNCENEVFISLETVLRLCSFYGLTLAEVTKEKEYHKFIPVFNSLKKNSYISVNDIPLVYQSEFKNFFASEDAVCGRADFARWMNILDYRGRVCKKKRGGLGDKILNLAVKDSVPYIKRHHIWAYNFIVINQVGVYDLRKENEQYYCLRQA